MEKRLEKDLVIGIDSSTSATKATAWDRNGRLVCEGREPIPMANPAPGRFEQQPEDWWKSTVSALAQVTAAADPRRIAALSISNQRETFGIFDAEGAPIRSGMVWLDERALAETEMFAGEFGGERIREISGKPVDVVVPINRMIWLRDREPENFARTHKYADVHCYLAFRLCGKWMTSTASADPSGMLDVARGRWSRALLAGAGIPRRYMPDLAAPGAVIGHVGPAAAADTGLAEGTVLAAGGGDGQCAACGAGAVESSHAYMNLGTAVVAGVYSRTYSHSRSFRTETAVSDSGYIFETVLKSGTFLIDWFARELGGSRGGSHEQVLRRLEAEAAQSPIGGGGIALLPFWQGSMTPHWDAKARGVIAGISGSTSRGDIYRALLEGVVLDQAGALEKAMAAMNGKLSRIIAIGGGTASQLLVQILADAINVPVCKAGISEASALGAAMCAAKGAGWFGTLREASRAMSQHDLTVTGPIPANAARYAELRRIHDDLWPHLSSWNRRMWSFANRS